MSEHETTHNLLLKVYQISIWYTMNAELKYSSQKIEIAQKAQNSTKMTFFLHVVLKAEVN